MAHGGGAPGGVPRFGLDRGGPKKFCDPMPKGGGGGGAETTGGEMG